MTVTFQMQHEPGIAARRRDHLAHVGEVYGTPLSVAQLDELAPLDDVTALRRAFPWLSAEEVSEALWALGQP